MSIKPPSFWRLESKLDSQLINAQRLLLIAEKQIQCDSHQWKDDSYLIGNTEMFQQIICTRCGATWSEQDDEAS